MCGSTEGLACYVPEAGIIVSGEEVPGHFPVEQDLAHAYGHRIAFKRDNAPFSANLRGPKYWSTYENVCALTKRRILWPGDEGAHYAQNPAEGWAESYRRWNEV